MTLKRALSAGLLAIATALSLACRPVTPVAYEPQPSRAHDPKRELESLLVASPQDGCTAKVEFPDRVMIVRYECATYGTYALLNRVVRFDDIERIALERRSDGYAIVVHQRGAEAFAWSTRTLNEVERLADAIAALAGAAR